MLGVVPRKASKIRYPEVISELGLDSAFIRGYFDGDGWVIKTKRHRLQRGLGFASNRDFLDGMAAVIERELGISKPIFTTKSVSKSRPRIDPYHGRIEYRRNGDTKRIVDFMCEDMGFFMERKLGELYKFYKLKLDNGRKLTEQQHNSHLHKKFYLPVTNQQAYNQLLMVSSTNEISLPTIPQTNYYRHPKNKITFQGRTQSLDKWAKEVGLKDRNSLYRRIQRWGVEEALTRPVKKELDPATIYEIRKDHILSNDEMGKKFDLPPQRIRHIRKGYTYKNIHPELIWKDMYKERLYDAPHAKKITYQGKEMKLTDWAKEVNIPYQTISKRIKAGWSIGEALGLVKPEKKEPQDYLKNKTLEYNGRSATYEEWSELTGLPVTTINSRVLAQWPTKAVLFAKEGTRIDDYLQEERIKGLWQFLKFIL
jgi:hypothetical protein